MRNCISWFNKKKTTLRQKYNYIVKENYISLLEYGPVKVKIEEDSVAASYNSNCCMVKNEEQPDKEAIHEIPRNNDVPTSSNHSTGYLSPYNINLELLSPQPDDNYQIPSPCSNLQYIESVQSPVYPRFIDRPSPTVSPLPSAFTKLDNASHSNLPKNSAYNFQPTDVEKSSSMTPQSQRLNHDYQFNLDSVKSEPSDSSYRDDQRGKLTGCSDFNRERIRISVLIIQILLVIKSRTCFQLKRLFSNLQ